VPSPTDGPSTNGDCLLPRWQPRAAATFVPCSAWWSQARPHPWGMKAEKNRSWAVASMCPPGAGRRPPAPAHPPTHRTWVPAHFSPTVSGAAWLLGHSLETLRGRNIVGVACLPLKLSLDGLETGTMDWELEIGLFQWLDLGFVLAWIILRLYRFGPIRSYLVSWVKSFGYCSNFVCIW
jgi:hypothetical protein